MFRLFAINLAGIAFVLVAGELVFGTWFGGNALASLNIPRNTDIRYDVQVPGGPAWQGEYRRDQWGLRGNYRQPGDIRLLTMGGSTTDQRLLSNDDTWQMRMAAELARRGVPLSIANAGVDGQSTIGHLRSLEVWLRHVPDLRPRWTLVYAGINDVAVSDIAVENDTLAPPGHWRRTVTEHSALYRLWRTLRGMAAAEKYKVSHDLLPEPADQWRPAEPAPPRPAALEAYAGRLRQLATALRQWGSEPVFVTQPMRDMRVEDGRVWVRNATAVPALHHFNRAMLDVCAEMGLSCLDLAGELRFQPGDFYDTIHTTPQGADRIGRWLGERLPARLGG